MLGLTPIQTDTIKGIKKGDKRFIWLKGAVREVEVKSTYNHKDGICIQYETTRIRGSTWVDISQLFMTAKECINYHISAVKMKQAKTLAKLQDQAKEFER